MGCKLSNCAVADFIKLGGGSGPLMVHCALIKVIGATMGTAPTGAFTITLISKNYGCCSALFCSALLCSFLFTDVSDAGLGRRKKVDFLILSSNCLLLRIFIVGGFLKLDEKDTGAVSFCFTPTTMKCRRCCSTNCGGKQ